jgi:hypothetical protein
VLDESASIASSPPAGSPPGTPSEVDDVRAAADAFVGALSGSGAEVGIIAFAQRARTLVPYTRVDGGTITSTFDPAITGTASPSYPFPPSQYGTRNGTNWSGAFSQVAALGALPTLVVFVTDGDPNATNATLPLGTSTSATGGFSTTVNGGIDPMSAAFDEADALKDAGTRVFAVGVGSAVANTQSESRLTAVSGPVQWTPGSSHNTATSNASFADSDWVSAPDFTDLKPSLEAIVGELCGGSLTIIKEDYLAPGWQDAPNWTFSVHLDSSPTTHTWRLPAAFAGTSVGSVHADTNTVGEAVFSWDLEHEVPVRLTIAKETERPGWHEEYEACAIKDTTTVLRTLRRVPPAHSRGTAIATNLTVPPGAWVTCAVYNKEPTAMLTVVKAVRPIEDRGRFNVFVGSEPWLTNVGAPGDSMTRVIGLGTHTVSGTAVSPTELGDYLTTIQCVDLNHDDRLVKENTGETEITFDVHNVDEHIQCTITNLAESEPGAHGDFGQVTVIKHLIGDTEARFNLHVGGAVTEELRDAKDGSTLHLPHVPFGPITVTETAVPPTNLAHFDITTICTNEGELAPGATVITNPRGPNVSFELTETHDNIVCIIENRRANVRVAHIKVVKHLVPSRDLGLFDLLIGGKVWAPAVGDRGSTGRLQFEVNKRWTVTEQAAAGTGTRLAEFSINTRCVNMAHGDRTVAHNPTGPSPSFNLHAGDDIVCTITNKRVAAPPPGGGAGDVANPCLNFDCGDTAAAPNLAITKKMPMHAHVREVVPITITVHNLGHGTAKAVQLHETPPTGMRIVHVANHGSIRHNGIAVWRLGHLARGESRTVHATARVLRTGVHLNSAIATALNADPAITQAVLRAGAAAHRRKPPRVTG